MLDWIEKLDATATEKIKIQRASEEKFKDVKDSKNVIFENTIQDAVKAAAKKEIDSDNDDDAEIMEIFKSPDWQKDSGDFALIDSSIFDRAGNAGFIQLGSAANVAIKYCGVKPDGKDSSYDIDRKILSGEYALKEPPAGTTFKNKWER